jgi:signal transduction histidine kinase/CheY-like chemotaxis protein
MSLFTRHQDEAIETNRIGLLFAVAGGSYPIWWILAPAATNPYLPWLIVGVVYILLGFAVVRTERMPPSIVLTIPMTAVTLHQQTLFWLNPTEPYFAVASVMSVVATLPLIRSDRIRIGYSVLVLGVSVAHLIMGSGGTSFLGVGLAWLFVLLGGQAVTQERTFADLTVATKQLEHERSERQRLEHELQTAQRMDSLGRLAGAFSHEFNNQLMAIRIHADLLERGLPPNAPQRRDVAQIQQTTSAAADLTARLLAFSRPARTREEPAELGSVLRQNVVTLRHLMGPQTALTLDIPDETLHVPIGAKQLGQILLNLALNARDALPNGGSLRVSLTRVARSSVELPVEMASESLACLTISDSGVGMSAEVRDRLFEPFFTTKASTGSSGLGLSVVYGLVKDSGGHIRVTSEPGQGARFDIYWPLVAAPTAAHAAQPALAQPRLRRARVLLVEDQAALRDGLTRWLSDQGYVVISCESAEEALVRANDVDVIASDVVLRGMDGIELLGRLRRAAPALPAVLFSGQVDHLAATRRELPAGVRFLEKPFAPEALLSTLEALVEGRQSATVH